MNDPVHEALREAHLRAGRALEMGYERRVVVVAQLVRRNGEESRETHYRRVPENVGVLYETLRHTCGF